MGSSKTAQALITKYNYEENGMNVWLIKPSADTRDGANIIRSRIGLEVMTVQGTLTGETHWWNMVRIDGKWYHVDLLAGEGFRTLTDGEMTGYEWNRFNYPTADGTGI